MTARAAVVAIALSALFGSAAGSAPECSDPCSVEALAVGYLSPVNDIASGTRVEWSASADSHPTSDTTDQVTRCFLVEVGVGVTPTPVRFDIDGGTLRATTAPGTAEESTSTCVNATLLDGSYILPFRCMIHGFMNGVLRVHP